MSKEKNMDLVATGEKINTIDMFQSYDNFCQIWKMANGLSKSSLIPKEFQGSPENIMISLEMASRLKVSPFMVMQNIYVIYGKPSFSSKFLIGLINTCGRFENCLKFEFSGEGDDYGCVAYATFKGEKEPVKGSRVTIKMAKAEGWYSKNGSKWQTMPEKMLRYRSASFFANEITPDLIMGLSTKEEMEDLEPKNVIADVEDILKEEVTETQATEELDIEEPKEDKLSNIAKEIQEKNKSKKEEKKEDECLDEPGF